MFSCRAGKGDDLPLIIHLFVAFLWRLGTRRNLADRQNRQVLNNLETLAASQ
jgi:hypothetical protein